MRRNGDAVAPERRCRRAGTVMPLRRNGDAVAPERQPVSPMETQSLNSEGGGKGCTNVPPKASRTPLPDKTAKRAIEKAVRPCPGAEPAELPDETLD